MDKESLPPDLRALADDEAKKQDYRMLWSLLQRSPSEEPATADADAFDVDDAWTDLSRALDLDASSPSRNDRAPRAAHRRTRSEDAASRQSGVRRGVWASAAAAAVTVVALGMLALWWMQPVSVATAPGEQAAVTLPDGSTVELNGASRLQYDRGFDRLPLVQADARTVTLRGEGFFQVRSGNRPFRVQTENAMVEVLGTAFNVRAGASAERPSTEVTLEEGRVRVSRHSPASSSASPSADGAGERDGGKTDGVLLDAPGLLSRVEGAERPTAPAKLDLKYMAAWRTGGFAAQNAPLTDILRDLERQFGADLRLAEGVNPDDTLTLHYARSVQLDDVLRDICVIQGLSYRKTQGGYLIEPS